MPVVVGSPNRVSRLHRSALNTDEPPMERHSQSCVTLTATELKIQVMNDVVDFAVSVHLNVIWQRAIDRIRALSNTARWLFASALSAFKKCFLDALKIVATFSLVISIVMLTLPILTWLGSNVFLPWFGMSLTQDQIQLIIDKVIDLLL